MAGTVKIPVDESIPLPILVSVSTKVIVSLARISGVVRAVTITRLLKSDEFKA